jgi:hypothetical protein
MHRPATLFLDLQAGTGIADLIALEMSKHTEMPIDACRKKIWLVDSKVRMEPQRTTLSKK